VIKKILLGVGIIILLFIGTVFVSSAYNARQEPPQLIANFVDLNQVRRISKFRSCAGHTVTPQHGQELRRNMKHYFTLYPEYEKENFVEVYAPYDGYIALLLGPEEIWFAPGEKSVFSILPMNRWMFSVTHVKAREDLNMGDYVKAGEVIGYGTFSPKYERGYPSFDVVYGKLGSLLKAKKVDNWRSPYGDLDSIFNHMSGDVLAEYEQKDVTRENIILSKEERDSDPCIYRDGGPYFEYKDGSLPDAVELKK
jgi:hypothetical protein